MRPDHCLLRLEIHLYCCKRSKRIMWYYLFDFSDFFEVRWAAVERNTASCCHEIWGFEWKRIERYGGLGLALTCVRSIISVGRGMLDRYWKRFGAVKF